MVAGDSLLGGLAGELSSPAAFLREGLTLGAWMTPEGGVAAVDDVTSGSGEEARSFRYLPWQPLSEGELESLSQILKKKNSCNGSYGFHWTQH